MTKYTIGVPVPFEPNAKQKRYWHPFVVKEASGVYYLVYNNQSKKGTGPFKTAKAARSWYQNGGR